MSNVRRLAKDPGFLGLWEEGGEVYILMEATERSALSPGTPTEQLRVLQGRLQGMRAVLDLVLRKAKTLGPPEEEIPQRETPRLMRVVSGGE